MIDDTIVTGSSAERLFTVTDADLATALGSGDVPVLATPRMIAWMEAAAVDAVAQTLAETATSVGTAVEVDHVSASPLGAAILVSATVRGAQGSTLHFDCEAIEVGPDGSSSVVGHGSISRAVVDRERFLARLNSRRDEEAARPR